MVTRDKNNQRRTLGLQLRGHFEPAHVGHLDIEEHKIRTSRGNELRSHEPTLRFGDELRSAAELELPQPTKVDRKRVQELQRIVKRLSKSELDERELRDDEAEKLISLARAKQKRGKDVVESPELPAEAEAEAGGEVVDIMALIKKRMREGAAGKKKAASKRKTRKKKTSRSRAPVKRGARRAAARRV